jgi:microcystin-dependent protein
MQYVDKDSFDRKISALLREIETLKVKIYGRNPDGKITLDQIDENAITTIRQTGKYYKEGDRIPRSALPAGTLVMEDVTPLVHGTSPNDDVSASEIISEVVEARGDEDTLAENIALYSLKSDLISDINALESGEIDEDKVEGLADKANKATIIEEINDSEETEQIGPSKVDFSAIPGVVGFNVACAYFGAVAPTGWAIANGDQYLAATYPLAATAYAGVGSPDPDYFCVPTMEGLVPVGYKAGDDTFGTLGATVGAKTHQLSVAELATHDHNQSGSVDAAISYEPPVLVTPDPMGTHELFNSVSTPLAGATGTAGSDTAHNNVQPSKVVNWIVRLL